MSLHDFDRVQARLKTVADPVGFLVNLFAHAPVGFAVWSADGRALLTNAAFLDLFGSEPPPEYNVLEDDILAKSGMLALFQRAFAGQTVHVPAFWYDPRDLHSVVVTEGRRVAISMTIFPLFKPTGEVDYVAATYKDETEIRLAHERLQENEARLEQLVRDRTASLGTANRELEAFSYSVAHDLRAPLRGMDGFAQILMQDYAGILDEEGVGHLRHIHDNAILMSRLIDALLSLARVSRTELAVRPIDLSRIAQTVSTELAMAEPNRVVAIEIEPGLTAPMDPQLARSLLANLIGNAWKFTRKTENASIRVGKDGVCFFVRDNGIGFDMAHAGTLFVPFQRLHAPGDYPGTGIGLATCFRIVDRHGGRIWAEGSPGSGATVSFTIPGT